MQSGYGLSNLSDCKDWKRVNQKTYNQAGAAGVGNATRLYMVWGHVGLQGVSDYEGCIVNFKSFLFEPLSVPRAAFKIIVILIYFVFWF